MRTRFFSSCELVDAVDSNALLAQLRQVRDTTESTHWIVQDDPTGGIVSAIRGMLLTAPERIAHHRFTLPRESAKNWVDWERFPNVTVVAERPVDGAGLPPEEHARNIAEHLALSHKQMSVLVAEIRNALLPALDHAERGDARATNGINRVLLLCRAVQKHCNEE
jgi:hypothetical protein